MQRHHAKYTAFTERLTPGEVAALWFRRAADFGAKIHQAYPTFPQPGPDGLYLRRDVVEWFDVFHGKSPSDASRMRSAENEALRRARFGR